MATSHKRPEPLLNRAAIVATVTSLVTALVMFGVLPVALGDTLKANVEIVAGTIATVAPSVSALVHAFASRGVVTPVADPRNAEGERLVPAGSAAATVDASVALAEAEVIHPTAVDDEQHEPEHAAL